MASIRRVALLGFLPWVDAARRLAVLENPAALAAEAAARRLTDAGVEALFLPLEVSESGITSALAAVRAFAPALVVGVGQHRDACRVERSGRVPGAWAPHRSGESAPWPLVTDADALAAHLSTLADPAAATGPFLPSDDPGAYFCDHLCVELARDARRRGTGACFLHVAAIDGCPASVRAARLEQYTRQLVAAVRWLSSRRGPAEAQA